MIKRNKPSSAIKIGEGAFGQVIVENDEEVRKIHDDLGCMLQETMVLRYMRGSQYIVGITRFNVSVPSVNVTRWSCSLRDAMEKYKITMKQKLRIFRCVLMGLSHLHKAGILHSDLKISNILVDTNSFDACICDLGLSSLIKYARIGQTAPKYRPKGKPQFTHGHDMFGLCMSMVDLFSDVKINKTCTSKELRGIIRQAKSIHEKIRDVLLLMCPDDPTKAVKPHHILRSLFKIEVTFDTPEPIVHEPIISGEKEAYLKKVVEGVSLKYDVNRGIRCFEALVNFFNTPREHKIHTDYWKIYIAAALFIYSSLFGTSKYNKAQVLASTHNEYTEEDLNTALETLIMDDGFISMTMV